MSNIDMFKPIKFFGYFFIGSGICVVLMHIAFQDEFTLDGQILFFTLFASIFQVALGLGIVLRKLWGYYLFKFILKCLYLAFPLGTLVAHRTLSYMDKYQIRKYFQ
jgi:hypothetical protein